MSSLSQWHGFQDSVRWRVVSAGVEIDGSGVERTPGAPSTATRVWETYADAINRTARARRVPCELILATICTESRGKPDAVRLEPGYKSDEATPNKVSPGLMQTLISTAREAMQATVDRAWLLQGPNSIEAGTAYIARQARSTGLDPPLVAAAYNAGGLKPQDGARNRWRLRQYPVGTGEHCDRFVKFFNDAVAVLRASTIKPVMNIDDLLGGSPPPKSSAPTSAPPSPSNSPTIEFDATANAADVTRYSLAVLADILHSANLKGARISSTARTPTDQARVMYQNCETHGPESQRKLYKSPGQKVVDVYVKTKAEGKTPDQTKAAMETKIRELGPTNVSRHASDPRKLNVFDVGPKSITDKRAFEKAVRADTRVSYFLLPPSDPGYHLEIPQPA